MSWAGAGKRGAAEGDGPGPDGVLAASGVREPEPEDALTEIGLGPDENAVAVSPCGRFIAIDARRSSVNREPVSARAGSRCPLTPAAAALESVLLDVRGGERFQSPKAVAGRYVYAFSEQNGGAAVMVVAVTSGHSAGGDAVPVATTTVLHFVSGPHWSVAEIAPIALPGEVDLLEGARGGLVVATLRGTGEAVVVRLGPDTASAGGWPAPVGVVQLLRDNDGGRIDAVVHEPPPGLATTRFFVTADGDGGFEAAPAGVEAAVVSRIAGSHASAAAEVFQVPGSPRSFISLGRPAVAPAGARCCRCCLLTTGRRRDGAPAGRLWVGGRGRALAVAAQGLPGCCRRHCADAGAPLPRLGHHRRRRLSAGGPVDEAAWLCRNAGCRGRERLVVSR